MMNKKRNTFVALFVCLPLQLFLGLTAQAQSLIRVVEDESKSRTASLNGKAVAVFVSKQENLFIETSRQTIDKQKKARKNSSGLWEYAIELQLQTQEGLAASRTFTITQSGSANKTTFRKGNFEPNRRYYFRVEAVKNPIFLVDNTQPTDVHLKNGEAVVEINSIVDIKVNVHPELPCQVERNYTQAGYYSTMVIIDMAAYDQMRNEVQRQQIIYDDLNGRLLERAENDEEVSESEWYSLQLLQQKKEEAESLLADVSTIQITAEDANDLTIDISDIQAKNKRVYTVEPTNRGGQASDKDRGRWLLLADYALSNSRQASFGFTIGWAKRFGIYANVMTNGSFEFQTDPTYSVDNHGTDAFLWNGETTKARFSATIGGLYALKDFGYLYAGAGYGVRNLIWYTMSGQAFSIIPGTCKGWMAEAGMIFNVKHFLMAVGATAQPSSKYYELKVGLGYQF